jgi:hypothetical protein
MVWPSIAFVRLKDGVTIAQTLNNDGRSLTGFAKWVGAMVAGPVNLQNRLSDEGTLPNH